MTSQFIEPGHFLGTIARLCRSICDFTADDSDEVRFVTPGGQEWKHASTYKADGIVYIDLEPIVYQQETAMPKKPTAPNSLDIPQKDQPRQSAPVPKPSGGIPRSGPKSSKTKPKGVPKGNGVPPKGLR